MTIVHLRLNVKVKTDVPLILAWQGRSDLDPRSRTVFLVIIIIIIIIIGGIATGQTGWACLLGVDWVGHVHPNFSTWY